uniref:Uncharacterized protein n=1 Tax=Cannabis sativa TaxID=3483 RepID=A0A803QDG8_CANSA
CTEFSPLLGLGFGSVRVGSVLIVVLGAELGRKSETPTTGLVQPLDQDKDPNL